MVPILIFCQVFWIIVAQSKKRLVIMRYLQKERISRHLLLCLVIFVLQGCASRSPNHDEAENDINKFINNYENNRKFKLANSHAIELNLDDNIDLVHEITPILDLLSKSELSELPNKVTILDKGEYYIAILETNTSLDENYWILIKYKEKTSLWEIRCVNIIR